MTKKQQVNKLPDQRYKQHPVSLFLCFFVSIKKLKAENGFTLAELVTASGILLVISGIVLAIYFPTLTLQKKSLDYARLQQETQIILEIMAKDIRNKTIYYSYAPYADTGGPDPAGEQHLAMKDAQDNYVVFCLISGQIWVYRESSPSTPPTDCTGDPATNFAPINATHSTVTNLEFFIKPQEDPFTQSAVDVRQPRVTVVLETQKTSGSSVITTHNQTTIPQRFTEKR